MYAGQSIYYASTVTILAFLVFLVGVIHIMTFGVFLSLENEKKRSEHSLLVGHQKACNHFQICKMDSFCGIKVCIILF